jgi:hypothetical protein
MQNIEQWLRGNLTQTLAYFPVKIDPRTVAQLGGDLQARILEVSGTFPAQVIVAFRPSNYDLGLTGYSELIDESALYRVTAEDGTYLFFADPGTGSGVQLQPGDLYPRYAVPFPDEVTPVSIFSSRGLLVSGLNFVKSEGCLIFFESPEILFPDRRLLVKAAYRKQRSVMSFTWRADNLLTAGHYVANYLRNSQTAAAFQLAVAEIAGAAIIPWGSRLREIRQQGGDTLYAFDAGLLVVNYRHTPLVVNTLYDADTIVGDVVNVTGPGRTDNWWSGISWGTGMSLDTLCPFKGLQFPSGSVTAYAVSSDAVLHARFPLLGDTAVAAKFWEYVRQNELITGKLLNSVIGLPNGSATASVVPIDIAFEYLLKDRAFVIKLDKNALGYTRSMQALNFIAREKPVGSLPIFI